MMTKCPACGKENPKEQNFCVDCGGVIPRIDRFNFYRSSTKMYIRGSGGVTSNFLFTVGQNEKHTIAVKYNTKDSQFKVYVDSTDIPSPVKRISPKTVSVDIGKEEHHKLILAITGFWTQRLEASCDGVVVYKSPTIGE